MGLEIMKKMKILINSGNGAGAHTFPYLEKAILEKSSLFEFIKINSEPDGTFPKGIPNPILKKNQPQTSKAVLDMKADLGVAFDGDFDRCFFFDEKGNFVSGEYIVGLLAEIFLDIDLFGTQPI